MSKDVGEITREDLENERKRNMEFRETLSDYMKSITLLFSIAGVNTKQKGTK